MIMMSRGAFPITSQAIWFADRQLFGKVLRHNPRDICRVGQKGCEETNRVKLNGIPQPIVSAPVRGDLGSVFVVYEEILGELRRCRIAIVAAVSSRLLRREKVYGHFKSSPKNKSTPPGSVRDPGEETT
jgi:hypothetical protein